MKQSLFATALLAILVSCSKDDRNVERVDVNLTKAQQEYVRSGNDFGFTLLKNMEDLNTTDRLLSPLSAQIALSLLVAGADGNTEEEIVRSLGYGKDTKETIEYISNLTEQLKLMDRKTDLSIANVLLVNTISPISIQPGYTESIAEYHDCSTFSYDFSSEGATACKRVNDWVSENTSGLIQGIIPSPSELKPSDIAIILNALYFQSNWSSPFDKKNTRDAEFYPFEGPSFLTATMHKTGDFDYYEDSNKQMLTMDYGNGAYRFSVLLPSPEGAIQDMVNSLTEASFREFLEASSLATVSVSLPSFENKSKVDLSDLFRSIGIRDMFTVRADFSKLADTSRGGVVYVSDVAQSVFVRVDESGTEAASATKIKITGSTAPDPDENKVFKADHPFVYIIFERSTGTILFLGTYCGGLLSGNY